MATVFGIFLHKDLVVLKIPAASSKHRAARLNKYMLHVVGRASSPADITIASLDFTPTIGSFFL